MTANPVTVPPGSNPANVAFLLADTEVLSPDSSTISADTSIWHDGIAVDIPLNPGILQISSSQISSSQVGLNYVSTSEISTNQFGISQIGSGQTTMTQVDATQISVSEASSTQTGLSQVSIAEASSTQISSHESDWTQPTLIQVNSTQVNSSGQLISTQLNPSKIPFSNSILFQQFLSSHISQVHNSTPASIYTINNSAQTLWSSLLSPTTPLNINLLFTDLPTGQLAEAQITQFDPSGRPNGGTLLIDHNANGIGWYIDPTSTTSQV